jgi:hypothetical protein
VGVHPPIGKPPDGALHVNVTVLPLTAPVNPLGAPGALVQALVSTVRIDSFEGALRPPAFCARTRR